MKYFKHNKWAILGGVIITFFVLFLQQSPDRFTVKLLERLDAVLFDNRMELLLQPNPVEHIKIVDIDERSLAAEGRWPWSRSKIADLVRELNKAGAEVIAFDVVFAEPELNSAEKLANDLALREKLLPYEEERLKALAPLVSNDELLATELSEGSVVLGSILHNGNVDSGRMGVPMAGISQKYIDRTYMQTFYNYTGPIPILQDAIGGNTGFVNTIPDSDGIIRRSPLVLRYGSSIYPSLSLSVAMKYLGGTRAKPVYIEQGDYLTLVGIRLEDYLIPTDALGSAIVNYHAPINAYEYISATDVLNGKLEEGSLNGDIIFIGTSAGGLTDLRTTPLTSSIPGVEVHATLLDSILQRSVPAKPSWEIGAVILLIFFLGLLLAIIMPALRPAQLIICSLVSLVLIVALNYHLWRAYLFDLTMFTPLLVVLLLMVWNIGFSLFEENNERQRIKSMFGQYVPADHVELMLNDTEHYSVDGESREMTVMFADIRNFTTISETLSAADLKRALNRFFTPITQEIFTHRGTVDKYVGDMVMAFWGAPLQDKNHRYHAVEAAFAMLEATDKLKAQFSADGLPEFDIGIGINTGHMNVGDMGSEFRRAYTVIGDAVNVGSRVESLTKYYHAKLLVTEDTIEGIDDYVFLLTDNITVKGKHTSTKIYQPLGKKADLSNGLLKQVELFHGALEDYYAQAWDQAFEKLHKVSQFRHLRDLYIQRILAMQGNPPGVDWDGVYRHKAK